MYGRSFLAAGAMMSLIALPPIFTATRDGLQAVPAHMREARLRARQDAHRDDPPRAAAERALEHRDRRDARHQPHHRRHGDRRAAARRHRCASNRRARSRCSALLRGTGSTLTSYVFDNSPAGEGDAPQKAYAAAFVLLMFVLALNLLVDRIGRSQADATGLTVAGAVV